MSSSTSSSSAVLEEDGNDNISPCKPNLVRVALKVGEPIIEILRPGETEWSEHCYTGEKWHITDWCEFEGKLYAVTSHRRVAEVDVADAGVEVKLLETENYLDTGDMTMVHFFDVETDEAVHVIQIVADEKNIKLFREFC